MKVGFDAKRFFNNFTGLGNYSRFVVSALSEFDPSSGYFLFSPSVRNHPDIDSIVARPNIHVVQPGKIYKTTRTASLWRTWLESFDPAMNEINVFHGLSHELPLGLPNRIKKVVTVHDLIFLRYPRFYNRIDVMIYETKVKRACQHADRIVAVSKQTKDDLVDFLKIDSDKIEVVYQGVHPNFRRVHTPQEIDSVRKKYNIPERYLLNVGTIEERKNIGIVIEALARIPAGERVPLVVIGKPTAYKNKLLTLIQSLNLGPWVIFLQNVSFSDFPALYQGASLFVYPSLFEGFGIPLVEAAMSQVPVITSEGSCFSEAAGPGAIYVNPLDASAFASSMSRVLGDNARRKTMVTETRQFIERFTPDRIAGDLHKIYSLLCKH